MALIHTVDSMVCRSDCGACCIAPSITTPMPGMPQGKAAGQKCLHLDDKFLCRLWGTTERPAFCDQFKAELAYCGSHRDEAMAILTALEHQT